METTNNGNKTKNEKELVPVSGDTNKLPLDEIIEKLRAGDIEPKLLSKHTKKQIIDFCHRRGYEGVEIAGMLKMCAKTIYRAIETLREDNAVRVQDYWIQKIIGEMCSNFRMHHAYFTKLSYDPDATKAERAQSRFLAWKVQKEFIEALTSFGINQLILGRYFTLEARLPEKINKATKQKCPPGSA